MKPKTSALMATVSGLFAGTVMAIQGVWIAVPLFGLQALLWGSIWRNEIKRERKQLTKSHPTGTP